MISFNTFSFNRPKFPEILVEWWDRALLYLLRTGLDSLFENELCDDEAVVCVIDGKDLMYRFSKLRKSHQSVHTDTSTQSVIATNEVRILSRLLTTTAGSIKYTPKSISLMLPMCLMRSQPKEIASRHFFTHAVNFRETADKQLMEEILALI